MDYWLDLFTGATWQEFQEHGATVSGFRERMRVQASKVKPGDVLLCYLTGVQRWVGALEVLGPSRRTEHIWKLDDFPVRFDVKPIVMLPPQHGVPMEHLQGRVHFYSTPDDKGKYKGFVRMSPNRMRQREDGELVLSMLLAAEKAPVARPVDERKLRRVPTYKVARKRGRHSVATRVTVPDKEESEQAVLRGLTEGTPDEVRTQYQHTEIQYHLIRLGAEMGLNVWVARNDRGRTHNKATLGEMPNVVSSVPTQFNDATNRTIELIDVLWLRGSSIVAAFEVECTTSIYSGLLRMSDLLALQPNLDIKLFLVAPDDRRDKVQQEIRRPTFCLRERPLPEICGFLPFSQLMQKVEGIHRLGLASSLKPDFIEATAEYFSEERG